ncbi:MAG TPA: enoyl-CoA hydratase/isomerase family protein [Alphaproteobacteria bacterium]|jgi:enoyl-CoA hydratase|nr:enoyl-CoA hydratase/isomerase family protein [Alphaproteobacteria bacterium]MDP6270152.1 enoyl-CoA hydratase/isomerase family protein [Alphaproteobacteria bacterium]HJM49565.1 enoyl-CoA hydratase/isomerase family protein [Alphaproteobacteria bacterium]
MSYETIKYEMTDHIVTITLNRPERRNAISNTMNLELQEAWKRFRDDKDALVAIITGAGDKAFCAGWDLEDAASDNFKFEDYEDYRQAIYNSDGFCGYTKRADIFKPIIAAVNGYAVAAGMETALLADIRIGAENAKFGATERRWNIISGDGLAVRLPLIVGHGHAMELLITGRFIDVHEAFRMGLVNEVVPQGKAYARALELAKSIAQLPQGALRSDKETVVRGIGRTLEERLRIETEMMMSMWLRKDSHTQGAQAFLDKNFEPSWPNHGL